MNRVSPARMLRRKRSWGAPIEMGAGIAASPHCAERRICRCSIYLGSRSGKPVCDPASRSWLTSSGVAFHRTAPSCEEPDRSTRLRGPKVRWSFDLSGPASGTEVPRSQNRPVFCGPSWVDHSCVPLRSPNPTRRSGSRVALEEDRLFRRLFPAGPVRTRRLFPILPAEIGPLVTCRFRLPFPAPGEAGTAVPITQSPCTSLPSRKSEKCGVDPVDNGDIGQICRNLS